MVIEDGDASYAITSDAAETSQDIQDAILEGEVLTTIEESLPITIKPVNFNAQITAEIVNTVNTSGAEKT